MSFFANVIHVQSYMPRGSWEIVRLACITHNYLRVIPSNPLNLFQSQHDCQNYDVQITLDGYAISWLGYNLNGLMHVCLQYTCTCLHAQIHCIDVRFVMPIDHIKWGMTSYIV